MLSFDFQQLSAREKYKILIGSVVPRPIALVTTIDAEGRANAAPFSFLQRPFCRPADPRPGRGELQRPEPEGHHAEHP